MRLVIIYIITLFQFFSLMSAHIALSKDTIRFIETTGRALEMNKGLIHPDEGT